MKSILLIYTGGTIGMKTDPATGVLAPFDFSQIESEVPELRKFNAAVDLYTFDPVIDSSNVQPEFWQTLARVIGKNYDCYDGFVVLHGTDTMSYTASALSFMLRGLDKPVVFTGSQIPIGVLRTDGRENLISAIEIAAAGIARHEVTLFFQNQLFRANRTTKYTAEYLNAFRSDNFSELAEAGVQITYRSEYFLKPTDEKFSVCDAVSTDVATVKVFPGLKQQYLEAILSMEGLRGVVLESYGSGNAPTAEWFVETIAAAVRRGVVVLNVTQCAAGHVDMGLYETGRRLLEAGVVSGQDMTYEAAVTKLMTLLGRNLTPEALKNCLKTPLCGEFTASGLVF